MNLSICRVYDVKEKYWSNWKSWKKKIEYRGALDSQGERNPPRSPTENTIFLGGGNIHFTG